MVTTSLCTHVSRFSSGYVCPSSSSSWRTVQQGLWQRNTLHQDQSDIIFDKLLSFPHLKSIIASLLMVSKPWREAVRQYAWSLQFRVTEDSSLAGICKALPCMASVTGTCIRLEEISLELISTLTQLTSLELKAQSFELAFNFKYLLDPI